MNICSSHTKLVAVFALAMAIPASAQESVSSTIEGAPAFVIPALDTASQAAERADMDPMRAAIEEEISTRYADTGDMDGTRLAALMSGDFLADYEGSGIGGPVSFSNTVFTPTEKPAETSPDGPASVTSGAEASMSGSGVPNGLTPMQLQAIAMMAEMMLDRGVATGETSSGFLPGTMEGIPALGTDLDDADPARILQAAMNAQQPQTVDVGDGRNMYLAEWSAGIDADGLPFIANERIPGSQINVAVGAIFGEFGRVTAIDADGGDVTVTFESGDEISSPERADMPPEVPALTAGDLVPGDDLSGEIIVSKAAPATAHVQGQAPARSPRPIPRPLVPDTEHDVAAAAGQPTALSLDVSDEIAAPEVQDVPDQALPSVRPKPRPASVAQAAAEASQTNSVNEGDDALAAGVQGIPRPKPRPASLVTASITLPQRTQE